MARDPHDIARGTVLHAVYEDFFSDNPDPLRTFTAVVFDTSEGFTPLAVWAVSDHSAQWAVELAQEKIEELFDRQDPEAAQRKKAWLGGFTWRGDVAPQDRRRHHTED